MLFTQKQKKHNFQPNQVMTFFTCIAGHQIFDEKESQSKWYENDSITKRKLNFKCLH